MATISAGSNVFIRSGNERAVEAAVLSHTDDTMRVALKGSDDVLVLRYVAGTWVSENLDPVKISIEEKRQFPKAPVSESDCICSKELAAHLIHLLLIGEEGNEWASDISFNEPQKALLLHVI